MGRTPLILFLSFFMLFSTVSAYDFDLTCSQKFDDYYFGAEHLYFSCTITPDSTSDAKLADDQEYSLYTQLDSSALMVVAEYKDGKKLLFPTPQDEYHSDESGTFLRFYLPESDDGVDKITVTVSGYVPVVSSRLENLTVLKVENDEELVNLEITVVNKQKFYSDFRNFENADCADQKKLREARLFYNDGAYKKAEAIMMEIESSVEECYLSSKQETYEPKISELKDELSEINKNLFLIQYRIENDKDKIKNYSEIMEKWRELNILRDNIEEKIDEIENLVSEGKFSSADEKIAEVKDSLTSLSVEIEKLRNSIEEKSLIELDWTAIVVVGGAAALAVVAIAAVVNSRRKDKW